MPWTCTGCAAQMTDDVSACGFCSVHKSSWTVTSDATRQLVVPRVRFTCHRGGSRAPTSADAPAFSVDDLAPADVAPVVSRAQARALASRGERPASADLLIVRLECRDAADTTITVSVGCARSERRTVTLPPTPTNAKDRALLLVYGPGEGIAIPGVEVIDVGEEGGGVAPYVEVSALRRPPHELPTQVAQGPFSLALVDEATGLPLARVPVRLRLPSGESRVLETDETGSVSLGPDEVQGGEVVLEELLDPACWTFAG